MQILPDWVAQGLGGVDLRILAPELAVTAAGAVLLVLSLFERARRWLVLVALGGWLVSHAALLYASSSEQLALTGQVLAYADLFALDGFAVFFKYLILTAIFLTILASARYLDEERAQHGEYYALLMFAGLGMMLMASGYDLVTIFVGLELMALCSYVLVGFLKRSLTSNEAAMKYFIIGVFGSAFFLYGISLFYGLAGSTRLPELTQALAGRGDEPLVTVALIMISVGLAFKVAAVPFHAWAPDAYQGAPTPITGFISVASKAAAFAVLLRILLVGLYELRADWTQLLWVLAVASMTLGNVVAIVQSNVKRMLAYSSIAHAGYLLIGVTAAGSGAWDLGTTGVLVYLLAYTLMNIGAFAMVGMLRRQDLAGEEVDDFGGLARRSPLAATLMTIFMLSLGGIPPTAGFVGKLLIFMSAVEAGLGLLVVLAVLNTAISLFYYLRVVAAMWMKEPSEEISYAVGPWVMACVLVAALGTLAIGLWPEWALRLAQSSSLLP